MDLLLDLELLDLLLLLFLRPDRPSSLDEDSVDESSDEEEDSSELASELSDPSDSEEELLSEDDLKSSDHRFEESFPPYELVRTRKLPVLLLVFLFGLFVLLAFGVFTFFPLLDRLFLILGRLIGDFALILAAAKAPLRYADPGDVIPREKSISSVKSSILGYNRTDYTTCG